mgnify:CR=1 FL=1
MQMGLSESYMVEFANLHFPSELSTCRRIYDIVGFSSTRHIILLVLFNAHTGD